MKIDLFFEGNDYLYASNLYKSNFSTIRSCVNEESNLYCELSHHYRYGMVAVTKEHFKKIHMSDGNSWSENTYTIKEFLDTDELGSPSILLQTLRGGNLINCTMRRNQAYDEDALSRLESGELFEEYEYDNIEVEGWDCDEDALDRLGLRWMTMAQINEMKSNKVLFSEFK